MKTDALFYELFKIDPDSLFKIAGLETKERYVYESITIKTTEKRLDGLFRSMEGTGPNIFLEVQAYEDEKIYWRAFREITTYYEQNEDTRDFIAVFLFLKEKYDPGVPDFFSHNSDHIIRINLPEALRKLKDIGGPVVILKPLAVETEEELIKEAPAWSAEVKSLPLPKAKLRVIIELLQYLISQKFPKLTIKEVERMLELTPIEKTAVGKELIQIGERRGEKRGEKMGVIKGEEQAKKSDIIKLYTRANMQPESISDILEIDLQFVNAALKEAGLI